jgi:hypothetical protein
MATLVTDLTEVYAIVAEATKDQFDYPLPIMVGGRELGVLRNQHFLQVTDPETADYWRALFVPRRPLEDPGIPFGGWDL